MNLARTEEIRLPGYNEELGFVFYEAPKIGKDANSRDESGTPVGYATGLDDGPEPLKKAMICHINGKDYPAFTDNTVIVDSGTSCHMFGSDEGLTDVEARAEKR